MPLFFTFSSVYDVLNARYRNGRLCNVGSQNALARALRCWLENFCLLAWWECRVQRAYGHLVNITVIESSSYSPIALTVAQLAGNRFA